MWTGFSNDESNARVTQAWAPLLASRSQDISVDRYILVLHGQSKARVLEAWAPFLDSHSVCLAVPDLTHAHDARQVDVPEGSGVAKVRVNVKHDIHGVFNVQSAEMMKEVIKVR